MDEDDLQNDSPDSGQELDEDYGHDDDADIGDDDTGQEYDQDDHDDDVDDTDDGDDDADDDDDDAGDADDIVAKADRKLKRLRRENAKYRTRLRDLERNQDTAVKTAAQQAEEKAAEQIAENLLKALGIDLDEDSEASPEEIIELLQQELDETSTERQQYSEKARRNSVDLAVFRAGTKLGANVDELDDSRAFRNAIDALDPDEDDFQDQVHEVIEDFMSKNRRFQKRPAAPKRSGGDMSAGNADPSSGDPNSIEALREQRRKRRTRT